MKFQIEHNYLSFYFTGWFYHAPARAKKSDDPVLYPPMSQIPGLAGDDGDQEGDLPRPLFRDTDTKYIRLAKEGGRRSKCDHYKKLRIEK